VQSKNKLFILVSIVATTSFAMVTSEKQNLPSGIKLTDNSLSKLESYQQQSKTDKSKPFTVEFVCYKKKKKGVLGSDLECKAERVQFVESKK
jgi:hypothetical protein